MITHTAPEPRHAAPETRSGPPPAARAIGIVAALTLALSVVFIAFALPAAKSKPHNVPIGVVGPAPAITQIEQALAHNAPDGFAVTNYSDQGELRTAIRNREVYGGFVLGGPVPAGPTLLLASGGSPMVAQLLGQIGAGMSAQTGMALQTQDLAPLPASDPRGVGLAASALPLALAGILPGIAVYLAFKRQIWWQLGTLVLFAAVIAVTITALLWQLFGAIDQNFWGVSAGLFAGTLAMGLAIVGLGGLFGRVGLGLGAATAVLLGNPLSGINSAPELLPQGWGAVGQLLPQGANATLLRSTAYFAGAGAGTAIIVLVCWAVAGLVLIGIASRTTDRAAAG